LLDSHHGSATADTGIIKTQALGKKDLLFIAAAVTAKEP